MTVFSRPGLAALALNLVGAGVVAWSLVRTHTEHRPVWVLVVALLAIGAWAARALLSVLGMPRSAFALAVLSTAAAALVTAPTDGLAIVPAAVGILVLVGDPHRSIWFGAGVVIVAGALVVLGAALFASDVSNVLAELGGLLLAGFAAVSRRQFRRSQEQEALLRERDLAMREEAARVAIARDLHDVLAHSLGGLVIQLDAADALLEAGQDASARERVVAARRLAAEGLAEARRAVAALRDPASVESGATAPDAVIAPAEFGAALAALTAAHRSLGGVVDLSVEGEARTLSGAQAAALQRALQEGLSNARKHAPGEPVRARLHWQNDRVRLTVFTPRATALTPPRSDSTDSVLAATGGGHGLDGMRERFAALPLGGSAGARSDSEGFTVTAEARLS